jgi:hypothetical protein
MLFFLRTEENQSSDNVRIRNNYADAKVRRKKTFVGRVLSLIMEN